MSMPVTMEVVLILAALLFIMGVAGVIIRRNIIFMLLSVEIMLNAASLVFIAAGSRWGQADGQVMFLFILGMAAAEVSIGLALILRIHQQHQSLDIDKLKEMKG